MGGLFHRKIIGGENPHLEGHEHARQPPPIPAEADDANRCIGEVFRRPADKLPLRLLIQKEGKPARAGDRQADAVFGHLIGEHSGGACDRDRRSDNRRHEAVIEPGGRRLDPRQSPALHHVIPRHGHFRVAAEEIAVGQFGSDALLAGIDNVGVGGGGPDLVDVPAFDGIAEDDFHPWIFAGAASSRQVPTGQPPPS
jgi:hypothetical protein